MDLTDLISKLENKIETQKANELTLENKIELINDISSQLSFFIENNESKFHFQCQTYQSLGQLLFKYLRNSLDYLDNIEKSNDKETYSLTDAYYNLACNCLNTIRILSRDTDIISTFQNNDLLDLIQEVADLKNLSIKSAESSGSVTLNFNKKEKLTESEAQIVLKTRERGLLILYALKSMSNLIFNSKLVQEFYGKNNLAENISIYLTNLLANGGPKESVYINNSEYEIVLFKLKVLFLMTVFCKEIRLVLCQQFQSIICLRKLISRLNLGNKEDANLAVEALKILYNLTMEIDSVRLYAKETLSNMRHLFTEPGDKEVLNCTNNLELKDGNELVLNDLSLVLKNLLDYKCESGLNESSTVHISKQAEITSNTINLLTNLPRSTWDNLIQDSKVDASNPYFYENMNMRAIASILEFLNENLKLYVNLKISADILYPVLMLSSLMAKSNKTIRHFMRSKVLPPLTKKDLVNLPQNGTNFRNFLVKLMTDPDLQLKRLCAQFLFILCKESVSRLIKYTGYGNAAGLLAEAGLMLSSHGDKSAYSSESENSDTEDYKKLEGDINLITGQAELENETELLNEKEIKTKEKIKQRRDIFEGMTEEQKEYEAVQLANAIDKLTRLGGIKPATIGADGKPSELEHVLQLQEKKGI